MLPEDEGDGGEGDGKGGRSELAFRQLEKQNERLKEALIRCVLKWQHNLSH